MYFTEAIIRALDIYSFIILIYIIITWIPDLRNSSFTYYLGKIVEPYIGLFRRFNLSFNSIDFTPLVAIIVLDLIKWLIISMM